MCNRLSLNDNKIIITDHVQKLELTLNKLKKIVLKCNTDNYFFGKIEIGYFSIWATQDGEKPINKKIEVTKILCHRISECKVCKFICLVNHHRGMWETLSRTLAPLFTLTPSKVKFKWNQFELRVFEEIKRIVARNNLLAYPNFNKSFRIRTNSSGFQLGVVIIQEVKQNILFSRKLNKTQMRCTEK